LWEREAGIQRFGAGSERGKALAAEVEALNGQIQELEARLSSLPNEPSTQN
jgi:hypothetical protein